MPSARLINLKLRLIITSQLKNPYLQHCIDIANDKITIFEKEINLYFSTSGYYCIDIYPTKTEKESYKEVLILERDLPNKKRKL